MSAKPSDATKEHTPFEKKANPGGGHPRPRKGATAKKRARMAERRPAAPAAPAPASKGKRK